MIDDCVFCRIIAGKSPANVIYQDDICLCFNDIQPAAPIHSLIVPRKHIVSLNELSDGDEEIISHILVNINKFSQILGIYERGYRVIINTGVEGGQTISHLHFHILGGKRLPFLAQTS